GNGLNQNTANPRPSSRGTSAPSRPFPGRRDRFSIADKPLGRGAHDVFHHIQRRPGPDKRVRSVGGCAQTRSIEMITIADDELRRWLAEDVPYGDLTTHALDIGSERGLIRFEARQAMVAA